MITPATRTQNLAKEPLDHRNGAPIHARPDAPDDGRYVSKAEYWATYYDHADASYEWNDGYLEAKPLPNQIQYNLYLWFLLLLKQYIQVYQNGWLMGLETGFSLTVPDLKLLGRLKETVRKPDMAVIRHDNPIPWGELERSYAGICDLCVEALSDSSNVEIERDAKIKKAEYEFAGVQEYYILDPSEAYMHFYERTAAGVYVTMTPDPAGVIHSNVLPGFQFRLRDLQRKPSLEALALDEVYQGYVLLEYQAALAQAAAERMRAAALAAELAQAQAELARLRQQQS
ncbi:MAG: Uma2 family endonuclease [Caldilineaceae bacterium]